MASHEATFGNRVAYYRKLKNLSLTELANRTGITKSYLSDIERNHKDNPSIKIVTKLANELDVQLPHLIFGRDQEVRLDEEWIRIIYMAIQKGIKKNELIRFIEGSSLVEKYHLGCDAEFVEK
ncbi:helix-turn-helix domain-containing protein [Bacillus sp. FJAT-45037]|uniref:helix-turn-helix domain-containing protein n=1 Tax=Bacillus sp. FJAT-45037 TaxID=2011007 RepID=UPI0012FD4E79|nr:helix-turn-helix transcriptional regulator [Bacillus sp. FJAT-45037]